jgi:HEXXH motif-containing protein
VDHPHIRRAEELLEVWPEVWRQFQRQIVAFYPLRFRGSLRGPGSASHGFSSMPGTLCATVDHPLGLAQALVHELAHDKLRALGVDLESATALICNDPRALYASPVVTTEPRPMTAVFHAEYSFIHVTELDIRLYEARDRFDFDLGELLDLLERNVVRMEAGYDVVERNIEVDEAGATFVAAFLRWARRAIDGGREILAREGRAG